jgi:hypothetical protein
LKNRLACYFFEIRVFVSHGATRMGSAGVGNRNGAVGVPVSTNVFTAHNETAKRRQEAKREIAIASRLNVEYSRFAT